MVGIGLVGYGYWGPKLARNFMSAEGCNLVAIHDVNSKRAALAGEAHPGVKTTTDYKDLLEDKNVDAVVIATPVAYHHALAKAALLAGKDALVEKPLTMNAAEAEELLELAEKHSRILAVDHTFLFTGAVRKLKEIVASGEMGDLLYIDSVRINLGLFQQDVNVVYDLAPHDLSIANYLVDEDPVSVKAMGACHARAAQENLAYLHLEYQSGLVAHFHLSWLAPVKIRKTIVAGTRKMLVYDDLDQAEKVKIYDKGIRVDQDLESSYQVRVEYRTGDMYAPRIDHREALNLEAAHFAACVRDRTRPLCDGREGLRVVRILEAAQRSLRGQGERVKL